MVSFITRSHRLYRNLGGRVVMNLLSSEETLSEIVGADGYGLLTAPDGRAVPYRPHPAAEVFKLMSGQAFAELVADVRAHGVRRPIVMLDDMVLDGRNRYLAARDAGVGYRVVEYIGDDPLAFVVSENRHRRHESESERAMSAAKMARLPKGVRSDSSIALSVPTQAEAAQTMGVSVASVKRAKAVVEDGSPELLAAVDSGSVTVSAAAEVAKLPEAEQVEIVAKGPEAVRAVAKAARQSKPAPSNDDEPPVDPERRLIAKLTTDAMIDEIIGLRADLRESKDKNMALREEVADLKAKLAEATSSDLGKALGNAQRRVDTVTGRMNEYQATAKRLEFKLKKAEARVVELEGMEVSFG